MKIVKGINVEHPEFGHGKVINVLGEIITVNFFGEKIDVEHKDLNILISLSSPITISSQGNNGKNTFRKAFEAVNLGVVPPDENELINFSIDGSNQTSLIESWLENISKNGLCKVIFGDYGTGKSHFLHVIKSVALRSGWVTAFTEFDPKAADPAKPVLVYRSLMSNLCFPKKDDGTKSEGFLGLIKEIRSNWDIVQHLPQIKASPWFKNALPTILHYPHNEDPDYLRLAYWLAGQKVNIGDVRKMVKNSGKKPHLLPLMPLIKETSDIYCHHLIVINEICKALGYKGLALILDEAEHVRGFTPMRRTRANNFFDILSRSAHMPNTQLPEPVPNDFGHEFPEYWDQGPHFALFVGLTPGDALTVPDNSLRDQCIFLHNEEDKHILSPPSATDYYQWINNFLIRYHQFYSLNAHLLEDITIVKSIAALLRDRFDSAPIDKKILRIWIKIAALVPAMIMARAVCSPHDLLEKIGNVSNEVIGNVLPWEQN
ncbi:BREX system ATP-binding domain-containing protein [Desulfonatronum parangueonense]